MKHTNHLVKKDENKIIEEKIHKSLKSQQHKRQFFFIKFVMKLDLRQIYIVYKITQITCST